MKNGHGYTLVELLTVVAITGILAVIGVQSYLSQVAQARQRLVRVQLSTSYIAERTFFAEHFTYTYCLLQIHGLPIGTHRDYTFGFLNGATTNICGRSGTLSCYIYDFSTSPPTECNCGSGSMNSQGYNSCTSTITNPVLSPDLSAYTWNAKRTQFTVGAGGILYPGKRADIWTMDENKVLTQVQSGL